MVRQSVILVDRKSNGNGSDGLAEYHGAALSEIDSRVTIERQERERERERMYLVESKCTRYSRQSRISLLSFLSVASSSRANHRPS